MFSLILSAFVAWGGSSASWAQTHVVEDQPHIGELLVYNGFDLPNTDYVKHTVELDGYGPVTFEVVLTANGEKDPRDVIHLLDWPAGLVPSETEVFLPEKTTHSILFFPVVVG